MKRKTLKASAEPKIEKEILQWFNTEMDQGKTITNELLQEKALEIFASHSLGLTPEENLRATHSWMRNFKRRHGIKRYSTGDGYDGLTLPEETIKVGSSSALDSIDLTGSVHPADISLRSLIRRVNSLEQVMQQNVMHLEARLDEVVALLQQKQ